MKNKTISKEIAITISIIVTILFLGIFIYLAQILFGDILIKSNILILLISLAVICIPLMISTKNLILVLNGKRKPSRSITSELLLIPLSTIYLFIAIFAIGILESMIPVRNYRQYKNLYNRENKLIKNFPSDIPSDAYDIEFYYEPSFLQNGSVMNLYYKVNDKTIYEYKDKYKSIELDKNEIDIVLSDTLHLGKEIELNDKYRLYVLYYECDDSGYCNHGAYSYAAINETSNECIFALSTW